MPLILILCQSRRSTGTESNPSLIRAFTSLTLPTSLTPALTTRQISSLHPRPSTLASPCSFSLTPSDRPIQKPSPPLYLQKTSHPIQPSLNLFPPGVPFSEPIRCHPIPARSPCELPTTCITSSLSPIDHHTNLLLSNALCLETHPSYSPPVLAPTTLYSPPILAPTTLYSTPVLAPTTVISVTQPTNRPNPSLSLPGGFPTREPDLEEPQLQGECM